MVRRKENTFPLCGDKSVFELLDSGHFWLSETPEIPGSVSWGIHLLHVCSHGYCSKKHHPAEGEFIFANTTLIIEELRPDSESAKLIRKRANTIMDQYPVILTGDFNTTEEGDPYAFARKTPAARNSLIDAYRVIHPPVDDEASFSRWVGHRAGKRIDWILHSNDFVTLHANINYTQERGALSFRPLSGRGYVAPQIMHDQQRMVPTPRTRVYSA